jgi:hypothetical protein
MRACRHLPGTSILLLGSPGIGRGNPISLLVKLLTKADGRYPVSNARGIHCSINRLSMLLRERASDQIVYRLILTLGTEGGLGGVVTLREVRTVAHVCC